MPHAVLDQEVFGKVLPPTAVQRIFAADLEHLDCGRRLFGEACSGVRSRHGGMKLGNAARTFGMSTGGSSSVAGSGFSADTLLVELWTGTASPLQTVALGVGAVRRGIVIGAERGYSWVRRIPPRRDCQLIVKRSARCGQWSI